LQIAFCVFSGQLNIYLTIYRRIVTIIKFHLSLESEPGPAQHLTSFLRWLVTITRLEQEKQGTLQEK